MQDTRAGCIRDVIGVGPGQIGGVAEYRIDDQRLRMVIAAKPESDLVPGRGERSFDVDLLGSIQLVDCRFLETRRTVRRVQSQIAPIIDAGAGAFDPPGDAADIGSGSDHKVVFQLTLITVKDKVHARVDLRIADLGIGGDAGAPLTSDRCR